MAGRENQAGATMLLPACVAGLSLGQEALDTALERSLPGATVFPCPALSRSERFRSLLSAKCLPGATVRGGWGLWGFAPRDQSEYRVAGESSKLDLLLYL